MVVATTGNSVAGPPVANPYVRSAKAPATSVPSASPPAQAWPNQQAMTPGWDQRTEPTAGDVSERARTPLTIRQPIESPPQRIEPSRQAVPPRSPALFAPDRFDTSRATSQPVTKEAFEAAINEASELPALPQRRVPPPIKQLPASSDQPVNVRPHRSVWPQPDPNASHQGTHAGRQGALERQQGALIPSRDPASVDAPVELDLSTVNQLFSTLNRVNKQVVSDHSLRLREAGNAEVPMRPVAPRSQPSSIKVVPAISGSQRQATWLRSTSAKAQFAEAAEQLSSARHELDIRAWSSAEQSAWKALSHVARGMDIATPGPPAESAVELLTAAKTAIVEARDFAGIDPLTGDLIVRQIIRSHGTPLVRLQMQTEPGFSVSADQAIDQYLNAARVELSKLARSRVEAAEAMDLLASIYLARNEPRFLPGPTAICLRRAALQGQPENAALARNLGRQLVEAGLEDEAAWALQHASHLQGNSVLTQTPRQAAVIQLTPGQFASISQPVNLQSPPSASTREPSQHGSAIARQRSPVPVPRQVVSPMNQSIDALESQQRWYQKIPKLW